MCGDPCRSRPHTGTRPCLPASAMHAYGLILLCVREIEPGVVCTHFCYRTPVSLSLLLRVRGYARGRSCACVAPPSQVSAVLMLMRRNGETPEEVAGFVAAMKDACVPVHVSGKMLDIVGTGGDGAHTINISTAAAVLAAACGCKVCCHLCCLLLLCCLLPAAFFAAFFLYCLRGTVPVACISSSSLTRLTAVSVVSQPPSPVTAITCHRRRPRQATALCPACAAQRTCWKHWASPWP